MNRIATFLFVLFTINLLFGQNAFKVYINEVRSDDASTDNAEFIELVGPAGTDITGFKISHFNGDAAQDGGLWTHTIGSFIIPDDGVLDDEGNSIGFYVVSDIGVVNSDESLSGSIQNGPDGIILYDNLDNILDAVAWGSAGDLTVDDPGTVTTSGLSTVNNFLHVTVNDDDTDNSLQAPNNVVGDDGSGWLVETATPGAINTIQTNNDVTLPVELTSFTANAANRTVILRWHTGSEVDNQGFIISRSTEKEAAYEEVDSYRSNNSLRGQGTTSGETNYEYVDRQVFNGVTYWYKLVDVDLSGVRTEHGPVSATPFATTVEEKSGFVPQKFTLYQNRPNPFNPSTKIEFDVPALHAGPIDVNLSVYNLLGQKVATLFSGVIDAGVYSTKWNGLDDFGHSVPSGIYMYQFVSENFVQSKRMVLIK